jgi:hypothetical protein
MVTKTKTQPEGKFSLADGLADALKDAAAVNDRADLKAIVADVRELVEKGSLPQARLLEMQPRLARLKMLPNAVEMMAEAYREYLGNKQALPDAAPVYDAVAAEELEAKKAVAELEKKLVAAKQKLTQIEWKMRNANEIDRRIRAFEASHPYFFRDDYDLENVLPHRRRPRIYHSDGRVERIDI